MSFYGWWHTYLQFRYTHIEIHIIHIYINTYAVYTKYFCALPIWQMLRMAWSESDPMDCGCVVVRFMQLNRFNRRGCARPADELLRRSLAWLRYSDSIVFWLHWRLLWKLHHSWYGNYGTMTISGNSADRRSLRYIDLVFGMAGLLVRFFFFQLVSNKSFPFLVFCMYLRPFPLLQGLREY